MVGQEACDVPAGSFSFAGHHTDGHQVTDEHHLLWATTADYCAIVFSMIILSPTTGIPSPANVPRHMYIPVSADKGGNAHDSPRRTNAKYHIAMPVTPSPSVIVAIVFAQRASNIIPITMGIPIMIISPLIVPAFWTLNSCKPKESSAIPAPTNTMNPIKIPSPNLLSDVVNIAASFPKLRRGTKIFADI